MQLNQSTQEFEFGWGCWQVGSGKGGRYEQKSSPLKLYLRYSYKGIDHNEIIIHIVFSFIVTTEITNDFELKTVDERKQMHD